MSDQDDDTDKSFDPTPEKLRKAREKGEVAKSTDLSVAAAYAGLVIAFYSMGGESVRSLGSALMAFLDQPERLAPLFFEGPAAAPTGGLMMAVTGAVLPWFFIPFILVLLSIIGQKALVFAPSKLAMKLSRISVISNAKNKFGRAGLFEFGKSFTKLVLYSVCLGFYMNLRLPEMIAASATSAFTVVALLAQLGMEFLGISLVISLVVGVLDAGFQHAEHHRKNMMSRKEIQDETKDSEGDPQMKAKRRQRAMEISMNSMIAEVPKADVIIVNPTHYAVALQWGRERGTAPTCIAKGVDEVAAVIRQIANENAIPIHSDPPTARALHATIEIGGEILEEHYAPVAAAIQFAEKMRQRAKGQV
ncbi:flagellar type III secretion system protein FlhB [Parasedimentitalea psychrophila]|uniref:Flagellar type III secretion system protein FlhB n=1 Tax=Parasedimentitalea psychrophila TaxID=2997337 RepID=A0A9Y2L379_9RHOB|nr:flagellar type III secretion system protein FlhB [Parasedimentitalea psychrophila]WIY26757.1 flagellar type III secretion system protein FlhB [Parasedimentitalea psychrophila]